MELSSMMAAQVSQLQHTVNLSIMKMAQSSQAALATTMLNDFTQTQSSITQSSTAPHPTLGKYIDVSV